MARNKTQIEPAVAAQLSYKHQAIVTRTLVTIVGDGGKVTLTRTEWEKARQADDVFKGDLEMGDGLVMKAQFGQGVEADQS